MATAKIFTSFIHILIMLQPALCGSIVRFLPGFDGPLPFVLETGYIGVGESEDIQLFYYLFPSENNPEDDPLLLWFTGGPGCSTISAIFYEIGPLKFEEVMYSGSLPRLELNPYSWTRVVSIIFLDQPVGTGFSYARTTEAPHSGDPETSLNVNEFLRKFLYHKIYMFLSGRNWQWLIGHPEYQSNPMYLGGDSYSGITLPIYFQEMSHGNELGLKPFINLEGYLLGNPATNMTGGGKYVIPYAHGMGLIPDEPYEDDGHRLCWYWLNDESVRDAIHVKKGSIKTWKRCNLELNYTADVACTVPYHKNLSSRGYRSLIYSGDHDMVVPFSGTQAWVRSLNYSIIDDWRSWVVEGQIGGYTRTYSNNMTLATVKGGGHTAPEYRPKECYAMFKRWISGQLLTKRSFFCTEKPTIKTAKITIYQAE